MSEHPEEDEGLSVPPQADSDVVSLIKKMQQQLNFLEKKIDILIGQSPERSFGEREKRFSKPFRPSFGGGTHHGKRDFHHGPRREGFSSDRPREGGFSHDRPRHSSFSGDRPREGGFAHSRPREGGFDRPRERSAGPERSFDRKPGAGSRGFGHGDRPFLRHRKGPRS
jgi:hypothetical protein